MSRSTKRVLVFWMIFEVAASDSDAVSEVSDLVFFLFLMKNEANFFKSLIGFMNFRRVPLPSIL